jgi:hypothetical protein
VLADALAAQRAARPVARGKGDTVQVTTCVWPPPTWHTLCTGASLAEVRAVVHTLRADTQGYVRYRVFRGQRLSPHTFLEEGRLP